MKLTIGTKLSAGYAAALLALLAISAVFYQSIKKMDETMDWVTHTNVVLAGVHDTQSALQDVESEQRGYMLAGKEEFMEGFGAASGRALEGVLKLKENVKDPAIYKMVERLGPIVEQRIAQSKNGIEFVKAKGREHSKEWNFETGKLEMDKFRALINEIMSAEETLLKAREADNQKAVDAANSLIILCGVLAFVFLAGLSVLLTRNIAAPLKNLAETANKLSVGDISTNIEKAGRSDEVADLTLAFIGTAQYIKGLTAATERISKGDLTVDYAPRSGNDQLGRAFALMIKNNNELIKEIGGAVSVLASSSSQILTATSELASSAAETSTAISETTTTMEEVKQTAKMVSQKSSGISESMAVTAQAALAGKRSVDENVTVTTKMKDQVQAIAESIVKLSEQSQAIGAIITTVNELASQSNLLAVNASIEAAKAGEQGKGFAVVAQEVRSLAEQSKEATAQVKGILNDIQKAIGSAVMSTEQGAKSAETGLKQAQETGSAIGLMTDSVQLQANSLTQITASTGEQLAGIDQVAMAMEGIKKAGEQIVQGAKQSEESVRSLHQLGQNLKTLVGRYKI